jgi:pimeloyl-ACP methyl ester carboxylesterase
MADEAGDVAAIADELGIDKFALWGHSGGGPHALACAAALSGRLVAAASLAAPAPYPAEGIDWFAGMGEANVEDAQLMLNDLPAWEAKLARESQEMSNATVEQLREVFASLLSEVDRAAFTADVADLLLSQAKEGLRGGPEGIRDDNLEAARPWGFELSAIRTPLQIWHGRHDRFVPFSHGEWLAAHLPGADVHLEPEEGHVTLLERRIPAVHEWLVSHF